ncbi:MAG: response regulator transcription factor [Myxococcota bacterium]
MRSLIDEVIALGVASLSAQEFLRKGCTLLSRTIGADAQLGIVQGEHGWSAQHVDGVSADVLEQLRARWKAYRTELAPVFNVAREQGAAVDNEVMGEQLARSAYYREIMAVQGAKADAIVMLTRRELVLGALVLGRRKRFSKAEQGVLAKLAPALALGLAAVQREAPARSAEPGELSDAATSSLSPRERELVALVCLGYTNKEIAHACGLSPHTVRNRLASVFERLHVSTRAELAGLVSRGAPAVIACPSR